MQFAALQMISILNNGYRKLADRDESRLAFCWSHDRACQLAVSGLGRNI
jgi:hypothetical protein